MKIIIYLYYFFRSALLRGLFATIKLVWLEAVYEKKFGIKTAAIKKSESKEFYHYQGASYLVLFRLFSEISKDKSNFEFVDIGAGKGRVVYVAEYFGFNNLTGIELDQTLINEAENNIGLYVHKRKESQITFVYANALDYKYKNTPTIYFLFNPFSKDVLEKVLDRILSLSSRETWFIYMNPLYPQAFDRVEIECVKAFKTRFYTEALVFKTKSRSAYSH